MTSPARILLPTSLRIPSLPKWSITKDTHPFFPPHLWKRIVTFVEDEFSPLDLTRPDNWNDTSWMEAFLKYEETLYQGDRLQPWEVSLHSTHLTEMILLHLWNFFKDPTERSIAKLQEITIVLEHWNTKLNRFIRYKKPIYGPFVTLLNCYLEFGLMYPHTLARPRFKLPVMVSHPYFNSEVHEEPAEEEVEVPDLEQKYGEEQRQVFQQGRAAARLDARGYPIPLTLSTATRFQYLHVWSFFLFLFLHYGNALRDDYKRLQQSTLFLHRLDTFVTLFQGKPMDLLLHLFQDIPNSRNHFFSDQEEAQNPRVDPFVPQDEHSVECREIVTRWQTGTLFKNVASMLLTQEQYPHEVKALFYDTTFAQEGARFQWMSTVMDRMFRLDKVWPDLTIHLQQLMTDMTTWHEKIQLKQRPPDWSKIRKWIAQFSNLEKSSQGRVRTDALQGTWEQASDLLIDNLHAYTQELYNNVLEQSKFWCGLFEQLLLSALFLVEDEIFAQRDRFGEGEYGFYDPKYHTQLIYRCRTQVTFRALMLKAVFSSIRLDIEGDLSSLENPFDELDPDSIDSSLGAEVDIESNVPSFTVADVMRGRRGPQTHASKPRATKHSLFQEARSLGAGIQIGPVTTSDIPTSATFQSQFIRHPTPAPSTRPKPRPRQQVRLGSALLPSKRIPLISTSRIAEVDEYEDEGMQYALRRTRSIEQAQVDSAYTDYQGGTVYPQGLPHMVAYEAVVRSLDKLTWMNRSWHTLQDVQQKIDAEYALFEAATEQVDVIEVAYTRLLKFLQLFLMDELTHITTQPWSLVFHSARHALELKATIDTLTQRLAALQAEEEEEKKEEEETREELETRLRDTQREFESRVKGDSPGPADDPAMPARTYHRLADVYQSIVNTKLEKKRRRGDLYYSLQEVLQTREQEQRIREQEEHQYLSFLEQREGDLQVEEEAKHVPHVEQLASQVLGEAMNSENVQALRLQRRQDATPSIGSPFVPPIRPVFRNLFERPLEDPRQQEQNVSMVLGGSPRMPRLSPATEARPARGSSGRFPQAGKPRAARVLQLSPPPEGVEEEEKEGPDQKVPESDVSTREGVEEEEDVEEAEEERLELREEIADMMSTGRQISWRLIHPIRKVKTAIKIASRGFLLRMGQLPDWLQVWIKREFPDWTLPDLYEFQYRLDLAGRLIGLPLFAWLRALPEASEQELLAAFKQVLLLAVTLEHAFALFPTSWQFLRAYPLVGTRLYRIYQETQQRATYLPLKTLQYVLFKIAFESSVRIMGAWQVQFYWKDGPSQLLVGYEPDLQGNRSTDAWIQAYQKRQAEGRPLSQAQENARQRIPSLLMLEGLCLVVGWYIPWIFGPTSKTTAFINGYVLRLRGDYRLPDLLFGLGYPQSPPTAAEKVILQARVNIRLYRLRHEFSWMYFFRYHSGLFNLGELPSMTPESILLKSDAYSKLVELQRVRTSILESLV